MSRQWSCAGRGFAAASRGFSLVELLVSIAISSIIVGVASAVFVSGTRAGEDAVAQGRGTREIARLHLVFTRDLANAIDTTFSPFKGERDHLTATVRVPGRAGDVNLGQVSYRSDGQSVVREWKPFGTSDSVQEVFKVGSCQFEYWDAAMPLSPQDEWLTNGVPAAVCCVLRSDQRITAVRHYVSGETAEESEQ